MRLGNGEIYLDYNATTPLDPEVYAAMRPYYGPIFGNPSSEHAQGRLAHEAVEKARWQLAQLLHCRPEELIFTSGASEANNLAIKGLVSQQVARGQHLIISSIEHPAVSNVASYLMKHGYRVSLLPVDAQGWVNPDDLEEIITSKTILVSVMHANNEVGTIQPVAELAAIAHAHGAYFHCDAAQSVSKIPVHLDVLNCDSLSVAGHKMYAPKGIGALYLRSGIKIEPLIHGAGHEHGLRAGTENVAQIVGLGMAAEIARRNLETERQRIGRLRDQLQSELKVLFPEIRVNGRGAERLPNTLSISFPEWNALDLMTRLPQLMVSAGAACHSGEGKGSGVLEAMGVPLKYQLGTLRISLGRFCEEAQIRDALKIMTAALNNA